MLKKQHARCLAALKRRFDSALFTYEELRNMFIPLLLDQLFIFGIGVLSNAMVSSTGEGSMSAVNYAAIIGNLTYALFSAIAVGGGIVIARARGAKDSVRIREAIAQSCMMCTGCGVLFGILLSAFGRNLLSMLYPVVNDNTPYILDMAGGYLRWFGLSLIPYSLFNSIFTAFRSLGETKSSLYLTLLINSVYFACSLLFINFLKMGVEGSGLSFLAARVIGMAFAVYWIMRPSCSIGMKWRDYMHFDNATFKDIFMLGAPLSVEQLMFTGGMLLVQMYISNLPVFQTDAHGVANSVFNLYNVSSQSLVNITATICGQCIGAKSLKLTRQYCKNIRFAGRIILLIASCILLPATPLILMLYNPSTESLGYICKCVTIGAIAMPLIYCDAYLISSTTRAAGDSLFATVISIVGLAIGRMSVGYIFTIKLGMGVPGIWLSQCVEWLFRAVVFRIRIRGTAWIHTEMLDKKEIA